MTLLSNNEVFFPTKLDTHFLQVYFSHIHTSMHLPFCLFLNGIHTSCYFLTIKVVCISLFYPPYVGVLNKR